MKTALDTIWATLRAGDFDDAALAIAQDSAKDLETKIPQLLELADRLSGSKAAGMGDGAGEDDELNELNKLVRDLGISAPQEIQRIIELQQAADKRLTELDVEIVKKERELAKLLSAFNKSEAAKTQRIDQLTQQYTSTVANLSTLFEDLSKVKAMIKEAEESYKKRLDQREEDWKAELKLHMEKAEENYKELVKHGKDYLEKTIKEAEAVHAAIEKKKNDTEKQMKANRG